MTTPTKYPEPLSLPDQLRVKAVSGWDVRFKISAQDARELADRIDGNDVQIFTKIRERIQAARWATDSRLEIEAKFEAVTWKAMCFAVQLSWIFDIVWRAIFQ